MVEKTTNIQFKIINLFKSNYLADFHIREMAKLIEKNHVTILPHIKSLEENRIITSKTIGRNKHYSLNLNNITTKNYIIISEIIKTNIFLEDIFLIKKITKEIFNLNILGTILLFGSYAKKTFHKDSDIDLFYLGKISNKDILQIENIGKTYGKNININKTTLNNFKSGLKKKDPLILELIKNHIILQTPELFVKILWRFYNEKK